MRKSLPGRHIPLPAEDQQSPLSLNPPR